jgi:hypothetical protein
MITPLFDELGVDSMPAMESGPIELSVDAVYGHCFQREALSASWARAAVAAPGGFGGL